MYLRYPIIRFHNIGKLDVAEKLFKKSLAIMRKKMGVDHPYTLETMQNLADVYLHSERFSLSEPLFLECLNARKRTMGGQHIATLDTMNNLSVLYEKQGKYDRALSLLRECYAGRLLKLGPNHASTLTTLGNLAGLSFAMGNLSKAEAMYKTVLEGNNRVLGESHPTTLTNLNNYAIVLWKAKKHVECAEKTKDLLSRLEDKQGPFDPEVLGVKQKLLKLLHLLGKGDEAGLLQAELDYADLRAKHGPDHHFTLHAMAELSNHYWAAGSTDQAHEWFRECVEIVSTQHAEHQLSEDHIEVMKEFSKSQVYQELAAQYAVEAPVLQQFAHIAKEASADPGLAIRMHGFLNLSLSRSNSTIAGAGARKQDTSHLANFISMRENVRDRKNSSSSSEVTKGKLGGGGFTNLKQRERVYSVDTFTADMHQVEFAGLEGDRVRDRRNSGSTITELSRVRHVGNFIVPKERERAGSDGVKVEYLTKEMKVTSSSTIGTSPMSSPMSSPLTSFIDDSRKLIGNGHVKSRDAENDVDCCGNPRRCCVLS